MADKPPSPRPEPLIALPPFPSLAWRGPFEIWRALVHGISETPLPFHYAALLSLMGMWVLLPPRGAPLTVARSVAGALLLGAGALSLK